MPPLDNHGALALAEAVRRLLTKVSGSYSIHLIHVHQHLHYLLHGIRGYIRRFSVLQEQILSQLVIQPQQVVLMEVIVKVKSCLNQLIPFPNGQLLGHLPHFVPGFGDIRLCQSGSLPHILIVIYRSGHHAVINVVYFSVNHMGLHTGEIRFQIFQRDLQRSHVVNQVFMIAVMYIKDRRSVLAVQSQRKLRPVILPGIVYQVNGYIRMNRRVAVNDLLKQLIASPLPQFYGNVFPVINRNRRIILNGISKGFGRNLDGRCFLCRSSLAASPQSCCHGYR